jgi:hypothetical protein
MSMLLTLPDGSEVEIDETTLSVETELGSVTAHRHKAKERTIERWKNPEGYAAVRASYADEIQEAENALWSIKYAQLLDDAFGESLNVIGRIVGEPRNGRTDPGYRVRIRARIRVNQSFGTPGDLLAVCALLDTADFRYTRTPPAAYVITTSALLTGFATATEIAGLLGEAEPLGVGGMITLWSHTDGFRLADTVAATVIGSELGDTVDGTVPLAHIPDVRST